MSTVILLPSMYIGPLSVRFQTTHWLLASGTKGTPGSDRLRTYYFRLWFTRCFTKMKPNYLLYFKIRVHK
jgi:hypothetical protein